MYKTLLKYLKKYHVDIYAMLIEESLKSNNDYAFYYDIENKKLFKYNITDIEKYYKKSYKDFSWNPFLIEIFLYDTKNFDVIYQNYNNFLSVKKLKKIINSNNLWYRKEIKKYLRDEIKKEPNKNKKEKLCNLLFKL